MDRVIKFRGKRIDNGEWVYGDIELPRNREAAVIHCYLDDGNYNRQFEVQKDSVGQFTGCVDDDGTEIYEGDVVRVDLSEFDRWIKNHRYTNSVVEWRQDGFLIHNNDIGIHYRRPEPIGNIYDEDGNLLHDVDIVVHYRFGVEVIGNIYDNPDLLEGGDNE